MTTTTVQRVAATDAALDELRSLRDRHGPLMIHQSGGCCDGSSPMCYPAGDLLLGDADVHLGDLRLTGTEPDQGEPGDAADVVPVWMGKAQYAYWQHTHLTIDLVTGRGAGFSLEAPDGVRFMIRSRLLTDDELTTLRQAGLLLDPPVGPA
ncbi:MAG: UDP-glucose 4-epimerase [Cellulomonas sp. 73-145]|uniref:DUF779 domain-containing protein n=1 Tax=Cellulomonas sp. 73-145 TaxID=1895739 RepID=UPI0009282544|nr:DUF779 domain-containing protein [Cellulomonas sp. 73-145]MBN9327439.1 DUF779 domain-containing protein [Cellulomonas sp.]OJV58830.1 MAG: UDP-glucose 4-epimerase [Cellulomonas sp. 73-145]